jgi:FtsP/CotA-like multicopper oxidase with cupredoxin domain
MHSLTANTVSIDNHKMWIYAVDGQMIVPQQVDAVNVPIGDRFQAFVKYVFLGHNVEAYRL